MMTDLETETTRVVGDILFDDDDDDNNVDADDGDEFNASLSEAMSEAMDFLEDSGDTNKSNNDGDDEVEQTIHTMATTQLCVHPQHFHSFAKASFLAVGLRPPPCAGCQQSLKKKSSLFGSSATATAVAPVTDPSIVKCMACGAVAHRSCALSSNSTTIVWKEVCPVNGPSVLVKDEEENNEWESNQGDEYEMDLSEKIVERIRRKNSFASHASSDQESMVSQSLDEGCSFDTDNGGGGKPLNMNDPDVAAAVAAAEEQAATNHKLHEAQSPGAARRTIGKLLLARKKRKEARSNNNSNNDADDDADDNDESQRQEEEEEDGSDEIAPLPIATTTNDDNDTPQVREDDPSSSDVLSPNSGKTRAWFNRKTNENIQDPTDKNDDRTHFAKQQTQPSEVSTPSKNNAPWLSTTNHAVEEDYGDDASVSSSQCNSNTNNNDMDDPNKDDIQSEEGEVVVEEVTEDTEAAPRSSWFRRRASSNRSTSGSANDDDDGGGEATTATADQPSSVSPPLSTPTSQRFRLFSRLRGPAVEGDGDGDGDGDGEDATEAEFIDFLDVDEEEQAATHQQNQLQQQPAIPNGKDKPQNATREESEPVAEETPTRRGFGLFRRRLALEENVGDADNSGGDPEPQNCKIATAKDKTAAQGESVTEASAPVGEEADNRESESMDDSQERPDLQDVQLETAAGSAVGQASAISRFRLFARKTDNAPSSENTNLVGESNQVEDPVPASPASKRRSLLNWRKTAEPTEDEAIDTINQKSDDVESEEADEILQDVSQRSLLARVFTPLKATRDDGEGEATAEQETIKDDTAVEASPLRFRLFSRREAAVSPEVDTTEERSSSVPDIDEKVAPRIFSLFSFARKVDEPEVPDKAALQKERSWASDGPASHWTTATTATFQGSPGPEEEGGRYAEHEGETETVPLHYANHPFASVSRALQDNILALLTSDKEGEGAADTDVQTESGQENEGEVESSPRKPSSSVSLIVSPDSPEASDAGDGEAALGEIRQEPEQENSLLKVASGTYEAVKATCAAQQKVGMATVAGGIAGGVAGLMFAGPAGALAGVRYGQTAGALGVVLEGSFTVGVIIAGVSGGRIAADKIQEQMDEQRVLTIGENGVTRKVMLVRPTIRIDPVWHAIWAEAQRTSPSSRTSTFSLFPSTSDSIKQDRYEKTSDIVGEEDIPTEEKVLLLVSRVLSDKGSFPGHVYRCLMHAFKERSQQRNELRDTLSQDKEDFPHLFDGTTEDSVNMGDEVKVSLSPRARREDTHGVIKYITATLLEVRPGLASTPKITETTASVVEALVFGEVYDLVYEEIAMEATEKDMHLIEMIDDFEFARVERTGVPLCTEEVVSKEAIAALRRIPESHSAVDKLRHCVTFLEKISEHFESASNSSIMGADSLLKMVCQHLIAAKMAGVNAEVVFLEEFARDEQLLRGREGYALVTLQASLHFLNMSSDFETDIFGQDDDEENVPIIDKPTSGGSVTSEDATQVTTENTDEGNKAEEMLFSPTQDEGEASSSELENEMEEETAETKEEKKEEPEAANIQFV